MKTTHAHVHITDQVVYPDYSKIDSAADMIKDAARFGLLPEIYRLLRIAIPTGNTGRLRTARDIAYVLASSGNRDFSVDQLVYATGALRFGPDSLRSFASKHGCSHEWFRRQARELAERLMLPEVGEISAADQGGAV